jgi:hypothetical protein
MSRYQFDLAGPADDADLRRLLAETPMPGRIAVCFRREPSYFAGAAVEGRFLQVLIARDLDENAIVAVGSRSVSPRHVNGRPEAIGYLGGLRIQQAYRNGTLLARGYAFLRRLHGDGRTHLYLTTIAEGNRVALAMLTSGRAGLPAYHDAGRYHTAALARVRQARQHRSPIAVQPATPDDVPAIVAFLEEVGPRRQFFPCYEPGDFFTPEGLFRDLRPEHLLLARRGGRLIGTLAGWDQHNFRQTVVHAYSWPLCWLRPLYNAWARWRGAPRLPRPGQAFPYLSAALLAVADDAADVFAALLETLLSSERPGPWEYLLIGLHETDPFLAVLRTYRATWYTTRLYLVCWEDGEPLRRMLDSRPPYLELGCL